MSLFEGYERRINQSTPVLKQFNMDSIEDAQTVCKDKGLDIHELVLQIQPIAFENACWAYTLGSAMAIKKNQNDCCIRCYKPILIVSGLGCG